MDKTIYYYSGTGNSLWVARNVAARLDGADTVHINQAKKRSSGIVEEVTGIIFPVYIWGVPSPVLHFLNTLSKINSQYIFAIAVNAGQVSNTLVQLEKAMHDFGISLNSGFEIKMPSNYIPWGGPGPYSRQQDLFIKAAKKIDGISKAIRGREDREVEKGPLWQRILFTAIYRMSIPHVPLMDKKFQVSEKCNTCGICAKVCPADNIRISEGKPMWLHACHQCFACLQWCPERAIEYGRNTHKYERYHHPEIALRDMIKNL